MNTTERTQAPCQECGHYTAHSNLVGCLAEDCDCPRYLRPAKTLDQAHQERDQAMAEAEAGTSESWARAAENAVRSVAMEGQPLGDAGAFTPDDIWDRLERDAVAPPREPRALGPILKRLTRARIIQPTGDFTESHRRHGAPVRIYVAGPEL